MSDGPARGARFAPAAAERWLLQEALRADGAVWSWTGPGHPGYVYPEIGDRTSPKEWIEQGKPLFGDRAHQKVKEVLSRHYPAHISQSVDDAIRQRFPVKLSRSDMQPGQGRW